MGKWSTYSRRGGGSAAGVVEAYQSRIVAAGGSISAGSLAAVAALYQALAISGVWDKLIEVWPCVGNQLAAGLVKLKVAPGSPTSYTNANFLAGDYNESGGSGGLQGNGTTKSLGGGPSGDDIGQVGSIFASVLAVAAQINTRDYFGTQVAGGSWRLGANTADTQTTTRVSDNTGATDPSALSAANWCGFRADTTTIRLAKNGAVIATNVTASLVAVNVNRGTWFALNNAGALTGFNNCRLGGGAIGLGLSIQNQLDLHTAWAAFNTTIGR